MMIYEKELFGDSGIPAWFIRMVLKKSTIKEQQKHPGYFDYLSESTATLLVINELPLTLEAKLLLEVMVGKTIESLMKSGRKAYKNKFYGIASLAVNRICFLYLHDKETNLTMDKERGC